MSFVAASRPPTFGQEDAKVVSSNPEAVNLSAAKPADFHYKTTKYTIARRRTLHPFARPRLFGGGLALEDSRNSPHFSTPWVSSRLLVLSTLILLPLGDRRPRLCLISLPPFDVVGRPRERRVVEDAPNSPRAQGLWIWPIPKPRCRRNRRIGPLSCPDQTAECERQIHSSWSILVAAAQCCMCTLVDRKTSPSVLPLPVLRFSFSFSTRYGGHTSARHIA